MKEKYWSTVNQRKNDIAIWSKMILFVIRNNNPPSLVGILSVRHNFTVPSQ